MDIAQVFSIIRVILPQHPVLQIPNYVESIFQLKDLPLFGMFAFLLLQFAAPYSQVGICVFPPFPP